MKGLSKQARESSVENAFAIKELQQNEQVDMNTYD